MLKILKKTAHWVAVEKPAGFYVHPPEDTRFKISGHQNCLTILRDQLGGGHVYPVHRLDRATSGVLLFALSHESASKLGQMMQSQKIKKTYFAVTRGILKNKNATIDSPLKDENGLEKQAITHYWVVGGSEQKRVSLLQVQIETGRRHQIRRHLRRMSHPILGDSVYGDNQFNKLIKQMFGKNVLFLKAYQMEFECPWSGKVEKITSLWGTHWHQMFDELGFCGWIAKESKDDCGD